MDIKSRELNNKFKVIYAKDSSNPLVCIQLYVRIGSAWETGDEAGYSHFTEHLVFKSTRKYPDNSIMERVTFLGGSINAYTEYDTTCFFVTLPSRYLEEGLEVMAEIIRHANFSDEDFKFEKQVVIEEFKQFQNDPEDFFVEEVAKYYFKQNPYKNPIIGNLESLKTSTPKKLHDFYQKYYVPSNCFMVLAGDYDESVHEKIDNYFGDWKDKTVSKIVPEQEAFPSKPEIISITKDISNDMLAFALPDLSESNPDSYSLSLATKAFTIGKNSRLYNRLFTEEQMVDSIKVHSISGINNGITIIVIMPKKKADLNRICEIFMEELEKFRRFGLNDLEIEEHKKELIYHYRYSFEYVESLAGSLGSEELLSTFDNFTKYPQIIENISKTELENNIEKYIDKKSLYVFHIGKRKLDEDRIMKRLWLPAKEKKSVIKNNDYLETKMPNGMKIILKRVIGKPTIGVSLSYEVSQLNEMSANRGINLLTSGLMLYGNEKRNYQQFLNFCMSNGINFGISPGAETTTVKFKCFKEMLPMSLELLTDVIQTPLFPREHMENLKKTYISNIDRIKDYPHYYAGKLWKEMIFGRQSNLLSREGTKTTINNLSRNKVLEWYKQYYLNSNMSLAIVGDFDFEQTLKICENLFTGEERISEKSNQNPIYLPNKIRKKRLDKGSNQSVIHIGGFSCNSLEMEKNTAFHILAQIIGGDTDSLMFEELREKRGLAYSVDFGCYSIRKLGYFTASAIVDKQREAEAVKTILDIMEKIKKEGISKEDLEKTKNYLRGQRLMEEESVMAQAHTLSGLEAIGFGYDFYKTREERLNKVDVDALHAVAEEYFNPENYYIHIMA